MASMASRNRLKNKRKASRLIFKVNETDCSPVSTPKPNICKNSSNKISGNMQFSISLKTNKKEMTNEDLNYEFGTEGPPSKKLRIDEQVKQDVSINLHCVDIKMNSISNINDDVNMKSVSKEENSLEKSETDTNLQCVDMDISNLTVTTNIEKPLITLVFRDQDVANNNSLQIINFIKSILQTNVYEVKDSESTISIWEQRSTQESLNNPQDETPKVQESVSDENLSDLFTVDITPSKNRESWPIYITNKSKLIDDLEPEIDLSKRNVICFNCDGNHTIRDCPEPKDARRILRAKRQHSSQQKTVRYHETKCDEMFPGQISETLRRALQLGRRDLPPYIYGLRRLGYPPGWLKEAFVYKSGLEVFDIDGNVMAGSNQDACTFDRTKIIDYPGFNIPPEKGMRDAYRLYNSVPYNKTQNKEYMIRCILRDQQKNNNNKFFQTPVQRPRRHLSSSKEKTQNGPESPTLRDLEQQKKQLLAELAASNIDSPQNSNTEDEKQDFQTPVKNSANVMSTSYGTPLLKNASEFTQLPHPDKFSKDISPLINFENLPNSTGKYEQMTKVIDKVRNMVGRKS